MGRISYLTWWILEVAVRVFVIQTPRCDPKRAHLPMTGQDELTLLSQALRLGLSLLYNQTAEQAFIDDVLTRAEVVAALGPQRVAEIEYAKQALAQDVRRDLGL